METVKEYEDQLTDKWIDAYFKLKEMIIEHLPKGFELRLQYGMPTFVVPLSTYPDGYLQRKDEPLPFISIAAQKNHLALYHMGIMGNPTLLKWFEQEYQTQVTTKLNMGKSCIRFTNPTKIPYPFIGELVSKITLDEWVKQYEKHTKQK